MATPDNSPLPTSPPADPLDAFEPEAKPEWQLVAFAVMLWVLPSYLVIPLRNDRSLMHLMEESASVGRLALALMFFGGPALSAITAGIIVVRFAYMPTIQIIPRGTGALSAVLCPVPVVLLALGTFGLLFGGSASISAWEWAVLICVFALLLGSLLVVGLARLGPERGPAAGIAGALQVLAFVVFVGLIDGTRNFSLWVSLHIVLTLATIALGLSCFLVYRRQRKLEKQFQAAMQGRERERQMGR